MSNTAYIPEDIPEYVQLCPMFTGEGITAYEYFRKIEEIGEIAQWDDKVLLFAARMRMWGPASSLMSTDSELYGKKYTYATYKERVLRFFGVCPPGQFNSEEVSNLICRDYLDRMDQEYKKLKQLDTTHPRSTRAVQNEQCQAKEINVNCATNYANVDTHKEVKPSGQIFTEASIQENFEGTQEKANLLEQENKTMQTATMSVNATVGYMHSALRESSKAFSEVEIDNKSKCNEMRVESEKLVEKCEEGGENIVNKPENVCCGVKKESEVMVKHVNTEEKVDLLKISLVNAATTVGDCEKAHITEEEELQTGNKETGSQMSEFYDRGKCPEGASLTYGGTETSSTPAENLGPPPQEFSKQVVKADDGADAKKGKVEGTNKLADIRIVQENCSNENLLNKIGFEAGPRNGEDDKHKKRKRRKRRISISQNSSLKASKEQCSKNRTLVMRQKGTNSQNSVANKKPIVKKSKCMRAADHSIVCVMEQKSELKKLKGKRNGKSRKLYGLKMFHKSSECIILGPAAHRHGYHYGTKQMCIRSEYNYGKRIKYYMPHKDFKRFSAEKNVTYQGFSPHRKRKVKWKKFSAKMMTECYGKINGIGCLNQTKKK